MPEIAESASIPAKKPVVIVDPRELYFGQQHAYSVDFFQRTHREAWTRVPIADSPHLAFIHGKPETYAEYLLSSWRLFYGVDIPAEAIAEQHRRFNGLINKLRSSGGISQPVSLYRAPDGCLCIVDGNHRTAIALAYGIPLPARVMTAERYAMQVTEIPGEFYGSQHRNMPYQTIYHDRSALVPGRRTDLLRRFEAIDSMVTLQGKTILDLGSNYGMSSYLALHLGGVSAGPLGRAKQGRNDCCRATLGLARQPPIAILCGRFA